MPAETPAYDPQESIEQTLDFDIANKLTLWRDYQRSLFDQLSQSPQPRDWAFASLTLAVDFESSERADEVSKQRLQDAVRAAPDDVLVRWIALKQTPSHGDNDSKGTLEALEQLEPDNAAVWAEALADAARKHDNAAVEKALGMMSESTQFNGHSADYMRGLYEAYARYPLPETIAALVPERDRANFSEDALPLTTAMAFSAAVAFPSFKPLVDACRISPGKEENATHSADCAAVGRLMMAHGDTIVANKIGASLLRVSNTFTDDDIRVGREQDWVYYQFNKFISKANPDSNDAITAHMKDGMETGNELLAMRHTIEREGTPLTPPEDWVDSSSAFSQERLNADLDRDHLTQ
jgi:hypothetical protein